MPFATLLIFPLKPRSKHRVAIKGHPKFVVLEAAKFGLESGFVKPKELKRVIKSVRVDER